MSEKSQTAAKKSVLLYWILAAGAAVVAAGLLWLNRDTGPAEPPVELAVQQPQSASPEAKPQAAPDSAAQTAPDNAAHTAPDSVAQTAPDPEPAKPEPRVPSFDLVRIEPEGATVIAGQAEPGSQVRLMADGEQVADVVADRSGKFVALFDLPHSDTPRSLSAEIDLPDGKTLSSSGTVLIAANPAPVDVAAAEPADLDAETVEEAQVEPVDTDDTERESLVEAETPEPQEADVAQAESATPEDEAPVEATEAAEATTELVESTKAEPSNVQVASVPGGLTASQADDLGASPADLNSARPAGTTPSAPVTPDRPTVVLADDAGVRVLQPASRPAVPTDSAPEVVANLVIDTITYDTAGEVALAGRGEGSSFARVYIDDRAVQTVQIDPDGNWRTPLPDVDAGIYRLRIDEVSSDGDVTSRVETPFQLESPEVAIEALQRPGAVTVQKGFTLWAIATERFGDGRQYVRVYEANRDLIRDPDLIYPGQVFALPGEETDSEDG